MPLMTVAQLCEQLRLMPQDCYVGLEGAEGALTIDIQPPQIEILWLSVTADNSDDEDEEAFLEEFQIADGEMQIVTLRSGLALVDTVTANDP